MLRAYTKLARAAPAGPALTITRRFSDVAAPSLTAAALKQLLAGPAAQRPSVVDLREAEELAQAAITSCGVVHLPLRHDRFTRQLRGG